MCTWTVNVHFDNPGEKSGGISRDGMRIYYTPTLREHTIGGFSTATISYNNDGMNIPKGKKRWFLTRSCNLTVYDQSTKEPSKLHLYGVGFHAHLLGVEMYSEFKPKAAAHALDVGSEKIWHFLEFDSLDKIEHPSSIPFSTYSAVSHSRLQASPFTCRWQ